MINKSSNTFENKYSYPLNTIDKPNIIKRIIEWGENNNVHFIGRWGTWRHINSDVAIEESIDFYENILKRKMEK